MPIDNADLDLLRKREYIPVTEMNAYSVDLLLTGGQAAGEALQQLAGVVGKTAATNVDASGASAAVDKNARLRSIGDGNPRIVPIGSLQMSGLLVAAANDGVRFCRKIPYDLDRHEEVGVRCWWTSAAVAVETRTLTWRVRYGSQVAGAVLAAPATALGTPIAAQAPTGVGLAVERGNRGIIPARTFVAETVFWAFEVLMTAFAAAFTEYKFLLGLEIDYMPRLTVGRKVLRSNPVQNLNR